MHSLGMRRPMEQSREQIHVSLTAPPQRPSCPCLSLLKHHTEHSHTSPRTSSSPTGAHVTALSTTKMEKLSAVLPLYHSH